MSRNRLTRILLLVIVCQSFSVLAAPGIDDDADEDIYTAQPDYMRKKSERLDDEKFEVFEKVHDILLSLPSPIVDNLKLRKRVPVVIKMHEVMLKAFVKAVPSNVMQIDKNMAIMLMPVLIFILAQLVYMLRLIPLALISPFVNMAPKKATWARGELADKFSFDEIDQLGQIKAVSSEIQNAKLLMTQSSKSKPAGQGSGDQDQMETIKQTLQQQLNTVNQLIQSVQKEISEQERKRAGEGAQLQSIATKIDFILDTQNQNTQQTQKDFESIKEHVMSRTLKLQQNSAKNGNIVEQQHKGQSAQQIAKEEYLETEVATADQALKENEAEYYYSLPANQMMDGEDVEYYYDEEDEDEEEDEVQV